MAIEAAMRQALRKTVRTYQNYAKAQGWGPGDYKIFIRPNEEWGQIHVLLVVKAFPRDAEDLWMDVTDFLEKELKDDPRLWEALHLVVGTFDQLAEGSLNVIGRGYEEVEDLLGSRPEADR
jgi:hypothetical protein